jgi:hypothetical protein
MLLRCSICKGQFEVEPSPHKDTVFCSHCGAPLDMKPKTKRAPAASSTSSSSLLALAGEQAEPPTPPQQPRGQGLLAQQPPQQRTSQSPGEYNLSSRPSFPGAPAPSEPAPNDTLAFLASATPSPHTTTVSVRRKLRKKDNSAAIMVIIGTILICAVILAVVLILHYNQAPEAPAPTPTHQPGELFPNVPNK